MDTSVGFSSSTEAVDSSDSATSTDSSLGSSTTVSSSTGGATTTAAPTSASSSGSSGASQHTVGAAAATVMSAATYSIQASVERILMRSETPQKPTPLSALYCLQNNFDNNFTLLQHVSCLGE
ncbi:hypothetical protein DVH05_024503 [Phytophthora capsici]|nr:hypothetical protein DVH05_024503 [Phytophthora capsici]